MKSIIFGSSEIEETTTSMNVKASNNKIETTPSLDENKTDKIEKSKSASSNNQMNTVIPVTVLLVLIIGVAFILKRKTKKAVVMPSGTVIYFE